MSSAYHSLRYHWVCSTKERRPFIRLDWQAHFHEYIGGTIRGLGGIPLKVGGIEDHVHALIGLKPTHCLSDFVRELKKATSAWTAAQHEPRFAWQEGYSIFTVSASKLENVCHYIQGQRMHHSKRTFEQELKDLLEKHAVQYNRAYLV